MSTPLRFETLGPSDYERGKRILDRAKHPGFVGREMMFRSSTRGRVVVGILDDRDVGIVIVDHKSTLTTLSVIPEARGAKVGSALVLEMRPLAKYVKAIADRVSYFERLGYRAIGAAMVGQAGQTTTQLLERTGDEVAPVEVAPVETREIVNVSLDDPAALLRWLYAEAMLEYRIAEPKERRELRKEIRSILDEVRGLTAPPESPAPGTSAAPPLQSSLTRARAIVADLEKRLAGSAQ